MSGKTASVPIGWCMGGGYSLDVALQEPTLAADVINYGHLATDPEALKKINAPILGLFGGQDEGIPPLTTCTKFEATMKQHGQRRSTIKIYDDAGHGFENPNNKDGYRADDAADAWKRTVSFSGRDPEEIARGSLAKRSPRRQLARGSFLAHCVRIVVQSYLGCPVKC